MGYNVEQLITEFRRQMDDVVEPYYWSEPEILQYLNLAQQRFCAFTYVLKGSEPVAVTADDPWVDIPSYVVEIRKAYLASNGRKLDVLNLNRADEYFADDDYGTQLTGQWRTVTGTPRAIVLDIETDKGRLVPKPVENDSIELYYAHTPKKEIVSRGSSLSITDSRHQMALILYMRSLGYDRQDSDTQDTQKSIAYEQRFFEAAGYFKSENDNKTTGARTVRYGGL